MVGRLHPIFAKVLSATRGVATGSQGEYCVTDDGKVYVSMNTLRQYRTDLGGVSKPITGALIDNGANGGMVGDDVLITAYHGHDCAQVTGIAGNSLEDLRIVAAAGFNESTEGPVIGIFHQYAHYGKGKSIHSIPQMEHFDIHVDCTSRKKNGMQRVVTPDGWVIPLHIRNGLAYMDMRPLTQDEYDNFDHVILTSNVTWDPTVLDDEMDLTMPMTI